jgi:WD40 repeat protein
VAQSIPFGKSIVTQKNPRRWYYLSSTNFEVHFYDRNKDLGELTARYAEDNFNDLKKVLDYRANVRFQIFVYSNPVDYLQAQSNQYEFQSNEYHINRVAVYYDGNQVNFYRHVRTRLANVIIRQMVYASNFVGSLQSRTFMYMPDWFLTGLSHYLGEGWLPEDEAYMRSLDKESEKFVADAQRNPVPNQYITLKKSIWHMVAVSYGRRRLAEILYVARLASSVDYSIRAVLGMKMNTFTLKWIDFVRSEFPDDKVPILNGDKVRIPLGGSTRIHAAAMSPDKRYYAVFSERSGIFRVRLFDLKENKTRELPLRFGRQNEMKEVRAVHFPIAWRADGKELVFTAPVNGKLNLIFYEPDTRNLLRYPIYERFDWVNDLAWANDGVKIAASANVNGQTDLYLFTKDVNTVVPITNTPYDELNPVWSADSKTLFYTSNGGDSLGTRSRISYKNTKNFYDIFSLPFPATGKRPTRVTFTPYANETNLQMVGNKLVFVSDENGIPNLATLDLGANNTEIRHLTDYNSGFDFFGFAGGDLVAVAEYNGRQRVFKFEQFDLSQALPIQPTKIAEALRNQYNKDVIARVKEAEAKAKADSLRKIDSLRTAKADSLQKEIEAKRKRAVRFYVFDEREDTSRKSTKFARQRLARRAARPKPPSAFVFDIDRLKLSKLRNPLFGLDIRNLYVSDFASEPIFGFNITAELELTDPKVHHRFLGGFKGFFDFRSFDMYTTYQFLQYRVQLASTLKMTNRFFSNLFARYQTYSATFGMVYPITRYQRLSFDYEFLRIDRRDLIIDNSIRPVGLFTGQSNLVGVKLNYVYDNSRKTDGYYDRGQRVKVGAESYLSRERGDWGYSALTLEARKYFPLVRGVVLASRFNAGFSPPAQTRQLFMLGGVENWSFNQSVNNFDQIPFAGRVEDFYFTNFIFPMRGFAYNGRNGNNYMLFSSELRIPFRSLFNFKLNTRALYNFQLVGFYDAGVAWRDGNPFSLRIPVDQNTIVSPPFIITANSYSVPLIQGIGGGLSFLALGLQSRLEIAWGIEDGFFRPPQIYFSVGRGF